MTVDLDNFFSTNVMPSRLVAVRAQDRLSEYRKKEPGSILYMGCGLDDTIALLKSCYYLIGARPGTGKTAFLLQLAERAMDQLRGTGKVVVIFSAEMDGPSLDLREACAKEKLSYWRMVKGELNDEEYARLDARVAEMGSKGFYLDESSAPTVQHMADQCQNIVDSGKQVGLILFDYLQLAGELSADENSRVNQVSRALKGLAKKYACPVVALGQLNRQIETQAEGKQPSMKDLANGGERDPDGIIIMDRPWLRDKAQDRRRVDAYVVKHRHGPTGEITMGFDEQTMRFGVPRTTRFDLNTGTAEEL